MHIPLPSLPKLRDSLRVGLATLLIIILARVFLLEAFTIPTSSMENTLLVGDFLFVNKALYGAEIPGTTARLPGIRTPRHGDVVVFQPPHDPARVYVKRVVGHPGDTLEMKEKKLFRNGAPQDEAYVSNPTSGRDSFHPDMRWQSDFLAAATPYGGYTPSRDNWGPLVIPTGHYFVLGDNRDNSEDSRYWGFVDLEDIRGSPWIVYFSLGKSDGFSQRWTDRVRWDRMGHRVR